MTKKDRYRGLRAKPENFGVTPLNSGEATRVYRVRASETLLDRFGTMTAEERGHFIERAYALLDAAQGEG
ncbi:hypothetical protein [Deinococcus hopiensis]|nr:hypothetical protein [Deinococcus hopiensis]